MAFENSLEPCAGPGSELGDLVEGGVSEGVEAERASFVFDVYAVERQRVEVRVEAGFELDDVTDEAARVSGLLIGRSRAELGLLERVLATLIRELGRRRATASSDLP